ncbi:kinase-like domain-containing protein [Syncephalis fuscata]|nr:kinase-like domain-containing protein [Syncephalis fuscata]
MSSHQLLLRLFNSEYFNSWLAVSYLFHYPDNIGIQHYLCNELSKFPLNEIEFFLPQFCHLLISQPTESVALETFVLDQCQRSTHIAILTFWYLQAYRADLASKPFSKSYRICRRVYHRVRNILFADEQSEEIQRRRNRVRENIPPAYIGIACVMAAVAAPLMLAPAGQMAVVQGRKVCSYKDPEKARAIAAAADAKAVKASNNSVNNTHNNSATPSEKGSNGDGRNDDTRSRSGTMYGSVEFDELDFDDEEDDEEEDDDDDDDEGDNDNGGDSTLNDNTDQGDMSPRASVSDRESIISQRFLKRLSGVFPTNSPTIEELHRGKAFSLSRFMEKAADSFRISPSTQARHRRRRRNTTASNSSNHGLADDSSSIRELGDSGIADVEPERRERLLTSHYFHSEMQFVMALVDISKRLCSAARPARQSALQAELTLLNHNLPADVCIPLWCSATAERPYHHQVVRVALQDCVVLNSAEKVPYLLLVEVLEQEHEDEDEQPPQQLGRWESTDLEEESTWQRSPSLDIDDEDTDELFGGALYKSQKIKEMAQSKENEMPFYQPELLLKTADDGSSDESDMPQQQPVKLEKRHVSSTEIKETHTAADGIRPLIQRTNSAPSHSLQGAATAPVALGSVGKSSAAVTLSRRDSFKRPLARVETDPNIDFNTSTNANGDYFSTVLARRTSNAGGTDEFSERMRTAAVMLAQLAEQSKREGTGRRAGASKSATASVNGKGKLEEIRERIIREMMALEEERLQKLNTEGMNHVTSGSGGEGGGGEMIENERDLMNVVKRDKNDPSAAILRESWEMKQARIRASSPFGHHPNWRLLSVIVKTGDDLRQEQFALQLIREMQRIWQQAKVDVWVKYYRILVTSNGSGLMETIKNSVSIHSLKKEGYARNLNHRGLVFTLYDYFVQEFGDPSTEEFRRAQDCFMRSLAGYSVVNYILQLKDRHNGNVLLDKDGHIIHIDFGFMLSNSPGSVGFEMAPFKLPQEYVDILGGVSGEKFAEFKILLKKAFLVIRKAVGNLILLIEMMQKDSRLPCLASETTIPALRDRCHRIK